MRKLKYFLSVVAASMAVYGFTICPTVEFIDSGELAMACNYLGIAHPTGYPLYTCIGHVASSVLWGSLIFRLNLLSLLFTSLASGFLFLLISQSMKSLHESRFLKDTIAASVALFAAFSPVWWSQGTTNEVYSLNLLLIGTSIWCLFRFLDIGSNRGRWLTLSAYTMGLCLTNNLSAVYLVPGYLYLIIAESRRRRINGAAAIWVIAMFVFPATLYLFLPIRAHFRPFLNWGGVSDIYFLFKHMTGWQYQVWMFAKPLASLDVLSAKLSFSAKLFQSQFGWVGIALVIPGLLVSFFRNRRILIFAALVIFFNLIYVLNYEIADIDSYFLPMFLVTSLILAAGLLCVAELLMLKAGRSKSLRYAITALIMILPIVNIVKNFYESDRRIQAFARQGVLDFASSMEANGVTLVENWDFYSPWLYLHFKEGVRPDIVLLDKELMRRSWYVDFIRRYHPEIYDSSREEFEEFLRQVTLYERARPYDPAVIDKAYYGMLNAVINHESLKRPVYTNLVNDAKLLAGHVLVPDGILFRFYNADQFLARPMYKFDNVYWENRSAYKDWRVGVILSYYGRAFESRSKYCERYGKTEEAAYYRSLQGQVKAITARIKERL